MAVRVLDAGQTYLSAIDLNEERGNCPKGPGSIFLTRAFRHWTGDWPSEYRHKMAPDARPHAQHAAWGQVLQ
jgi:hypothetical protein